MKGRERHLPDSRLYTSARKATVLAESSRYFFYFHRTLSAPAMSTDASQIGVALFPSFLNISYHILPFQVLFVLTIFM